MLVPIFFFFSLELLVMPSEVAGRQPEMPLGFCFPFLLSVSVSVIEAPGVAADPFL